MRRLHLHYVIANTLFSGTKISNIVVTPTIHRALVKIYNRYIYLLLHGATHSIIRLYTCYIIIICLPLAVALGYEPRTPHMTSKTAGTDPHQEINLFILKLPLLAKPGTNRHMVRPLPLAAFPNPTNQSTAHKQPNQSHDNKMLAFDQSEER